MFTRRFIGLRSHTVHLSEIQRVFPPEMYNYNVKNGLNYQPQVVSLPDFWLPSNRILGRGKHEKGAFHRSLEADYGVGG